MRLLDRRAPARRLPVPSLASGALICLLLANYFGTFPDLDFTWHVRQGADVFHTGRVITPDTFTYTIAGKPIPDFEWLYEVLLYLTWEGFGYGGLRLLKVLLVAAPLLVLAWRLHRQGVGGKGILLACFVAATILFPGWNLRPMVCTAVGLLLVSGWLHDHCTGARPLSWGLPAFMLLWANVHPGIFLGQGLLAGAIAWEWLNRRVRLNEPLSHAACVRLTGFGGLGLVASVLCPDPLARLQYTLNPDLRHPVMRIFAELQPLHALAFLPPYTTALVYLLAAVIGVTVVLRFRAYRLWEVATLVGLGYLANAYYRSVTDWTYILLALGVPHLAALVREAVRRGDPTAAPARWALAAWRGWESALDRPLWRLDLFWPAVALSGLVVVSLVPPLAKRLPMPATADWPVAVGDWIAEHDLRGNFFAQPNYGAYLGWRRGDAVRVYVDTRGFYFPPPLLEDAMYVPQLHPDWRERMQRIFAHGTDYFLLETTAPADQLWRLLEPHVGPPLYRDERTVLLTAAQVRRGLALVDAAAAGDHLADRYARQ
jgi:hypothetical protein